MGLPSTKFLQVSIAPKTLLKSRSVLTEEEVQSLHLVPHYVYALFSLHVYGNQNAPLLPTGWEVLLTAADLNLNKEGYFATAYINKEYHHCIIAQRGTANPQSLRAGVWTYFDEQTIVFGLAREFSRQIRLYLTASASEAQTWFFSYTGHSLGALLAACRAVEEQTYAVTFESPGCRNYIEKTMNSFRAEDADVITYLRPPNLINSLRPHCGYLVQLPFNKSEKSTLLPPRVLSTLRLRFPSVITPQQFIRAQLPRVAGMLDMQEYVGMIEALLREMLGHTQQVHAMGDILEQFKGNDGPLNTQVVLRWPSTLLQFLEYHNATKAMADPENQETNIISAYESFVRQFYLTTEREENSLPLRFLNKDSLKLLCLWFRNDAAKLKKLPLTFMDHKVLNIITIDGGCMRTSVLTALQAKQYLSLLVFRPEMREVLNQFVFDPFLGGGSKL